MGPSHSPTGSKGFYMRLLLTWLINALALLAVPYLMHSVQVDSFGSALLAALILGVFDVAGKYYVPEIGAFVIYGLMVVLLILFPAGLMRRRG